MENEKTSVAANPEEESERSFEKIKQTLETQKEALLSEAGMILNQESNPKREAFPDLGDQASAEENQNFTLRLREREQKLLKKVEDALNRISNETFGICDLCEEEISMQRLKARPVTTLCIECKTKQEEEENNRR